MQVDPIIAMSPDSGVVLNTRTGETHLRAGTGNSDVGADGPSQLESDYQPLQRNRHSLLPSVRRDSAASIGRTAGDGSDADATLAARSSRKACACNGAGWW